tara:strand:+ start:3097 stop:3879 length:783 start_codon:yes stop_codon:yes gene_type:complete
MTVHVYTVGTDRNMMGSIIETEKLYDVKVNYLMPKEWYGFYTKINETNKVIQDLDDNDILLFIDCYDIMINSNMDEIINKFKSFNCNLLISAELVCFPDYLQDKMDKTPPFNIKNKYPNAGGYIGYVKDVKKMMNWKDEEVKKAMCEKGTDQAYVINYYCENCNNENIKLDTNAEIFQSFHAVSWQEFEIKNGRVHNTVLKTTPCFLHFNGGSMICDPRADIRWTFMDKIFKSKAQPDETFKIEGVKQCFWKTGVALSQI